MMTTISKSAINSEAPCRHFLDMWIFLSLLRNGSRLCILGFGTGFTTSTRPPFGRGHDHWSENRSNLTHKMKMGCGEDEIWTKLKIPFRSEIWNDWQNASVAGLITSVTDLLRTEVTGLFGNLATDLFGTLVTDLFGTLVTDLFGTLVTDVRSLWSLNFQKKNRSLELYQQNSPGSDQSDITLVTNCSGKSVTKLSRKSVTKCPNKFVTKFSKMKIQHPRSDQIDLTLVTNSSISKTPPKWPKWPHIGHLWWGWVKKNLAHKFCAACFFLPTPSKVTKVT